MFIIYSSLCYCNPIFTSDAFAVDENTPLEWESDDLQEDSESSRSAMEKQYLKSVDIDFIDGLLFKIKLDTFYEHAKFINFLLNLKNQTVAFNDLSVSIQRFEKSHDKRQLKILHLERIKIALFVGLLRLTPLSQGDIVTPKFYGVATEKIVEEFMFEYYQIEQVNSLFKIFLKDYQTFIEKNFSKLTYIQCTINTCLEETRRISGTITSQHATNTLPMDSSS